MDKQEGNDFTQIGQVIMSYYIYYVTFCHPDIITNLSFWRFYNEMQLQSREEIGIKRESKSTEDGSYITTAINYFHNQLI